MNTLPSEQPTTDPPPIANYQAKLILDPSITTPESRKRPHSIPKKSAHAATRDKKPKQKNFEP